MTRAAKKPIAEIGSNVDALKRSTLEKYARIQAKIDVLHGEQKDVLNEGKKGGAGKTAVRKAYKILKMSEEQLQARKEVEEETDHITELCRDLPLFNYGE